MCVLFQNTFLIVHSLLSISLGSTSLLKAPQGLLMTLRVISKFLVVATMPYVIQTLPLPHLIFHHCLHPSLPSSTTSLSRPEQPKISLSLGLCTCSLVCLECFPLGSSCG